MEGAVDTHPPAGYPAPVLKISNFNNPADQRFGNRAIVGIFAVKLVMSSLDLERDLEKIALRAAEREEENRAFRSFLQGRDAAEVDERVQRLNGEISARIDCTSC